MDKNLFSGAVLAGIFLGVPFFAAAAQDARPPSPPVVEVRVHVSTGGRFVDGLKLEDFEVLEDSKPQAIDSLRLVRGRDVVFKQENKPYEPRLARSYTLLFQAVDWDPKLVEAVDHLFASVLKPGDSMTLVTPVKPYYLQSDVLATRPAAVLSKSMQDVLRKDILRGGGEYRNLINELKRLSKAIGGNATTFQEDMESDPSTEADGGFGLEMQIDRYRQALMKIEGMRLVDEGKLLSFAATLRAVPGQKTVILFYQREYRPEISSATMNRLMSLYEDNPDILGNLMDLFQFFKREKTFDANRVKRAFADAGISFHFIFMEKKSQRIFGGTMREQSEDIYPGFTEIARATGGIAESSQNPAVSFRRAAAISEDYYLLSYTPGAYSPDGGFRTIAVRVKGGNYTVSNRLGYYAR
ncbi:MAG: VWA domain-containing protein [Candidatus Aminicenantes bacterium]|nr:VWA domain-containing protein [Candidatus Aminicenantes bacterium]